MNANLIENFVEIQRKMEKSKRKMEKLLLLAILGILLSMIASVQHTSCAINNEIIGINSAENREQFPMLRDGTNNNAADGGGGSSGSGASESSEEQAPSLVIPSSLINSQSHLINNNINNQQLYPSRANRLLAVPMSLTRYLFSNSVRIPAPLVDRAIVAQSTQSLPSSSSGGGGGAAAAAAVSPSSSSSFNGFKRSSSALDSLTGVTLGKRSVGLGLVAPQMELVNYEPLLNRRSALFMRTTPRMYDLGRHWTTGSYDSIPFESQRNNNNNIRFDNNSL